MGLLHPIDLLKLQGQYATERAERHPLLNILYRLIKIC